MKTLFNLIKFCIVFWSALIIIGIIVFNHILYFIERWGYEPGHPWNYVILITSILFSCFCAKIIANLSVDEDE